jgi:uncharacterized protein
MRHLLFTLAIVLCFGWTCLAQTSAADSPATKEDVERYLQAVHSHDTMKKMAAAMAQGTHQMLHEQYLKHKDELPADYEKKMTADMDAMFENMPWDEMMQAMVPVYQKHFTEGDINNLIAFYSSPTGEKLLQEMPSVMAETMQDTMPIMSKYMDTVQKTLLKKTNIMIAQSKKQSDASSSAAHN